MTQAAAHQGKQSQADSDPYGWREEARSLMRALAGGAIVGMPLLYTMEMWWHGMTLSPWHQLGLLGGILVVNFIFSLVSGFREEYSPSQAIGESVTAVGIGIVFSTLILLLIGEIRQDVSVGQSISKVLLETAPVSVGVSFANSQVEGRSRTGEAAGENGKQPEKPSDPQRAQLKADLQDAGASLAGSAVFALNIAPTEEVIMIGTRLTPWHQLGLLLGALVLCYVILFASGFEEHRVHAPSVFQHPFAETLLTTAISLFVAFILLVVLGQREAVTDLSTTISATVTLGLPAVVGGAAGRLIV